LALSALAVCRVRFRVRKNRGTCAHCQGTRLIAVAIAAETEAQAPAVEVRDQPIDGLGGPITTDDVLDASLALAGFEGDLASLLR